MASFVVLTLTEAKSDENHIVVNANQIISLRERNGKTTVLTSDGNRILVSESPKDIIIASQSKPGL